MILHRWFHQIWPACSRDRHIQIGYMYDDAFVVVDLPIMIVRDAINQQDRLVNDMQSRV